MTKGIIHPTPVAAAVEAYLAAGLRPIPVFGIRRGASGQCQCGNAHQDKGAGKHPRDVHWADRGYYTPSEFGPHDNVALAMGRQPDGRWLVGLDFDCGEHAPSRWLPPVLLPENLPETLETVTPHGRHLIFWVRDEAPLGNWVDLLKTRGSRKAQLDIKYARGALIAGPSWHREGGFYETILRPVAPLPYDTMRFICMQHGSSPYIRWADMPKHEGKQP